MPFKSKAQQRFMFATMPKTAEKWAEKTPNMKNLPQKVKKEGREPLNNVQFWVVKTPTSHESNVQDIMAPADPFQFCEMHKNGLAPDQVAGFFMEEDEARKVAEGLLTGLYEAAKALEEKKIMVAEKLQKTMDNLQKEAQRCMKSMKEEPENADKHQAKLEEVMARMKDLRQKHTLVERSKKELAAKDYDKDGKVETPEEEYKGSKDRAIKQSKTHKK